MSNLDNMVQYPIEREYFRNLLNDTFEYEDLCKLFNDNETINFKWWTYVDEIYIIHKDSGTLVNWYKPTHLGRCLTCNKELSKNEWYEFFCKLNAEVIDL